MYKCEKGCCYDSPTGGVRVSHNVSTPSVESTTITIKKTPLYLCYHCQGRYIGYRISPLDRPYCSVCNDRGWTV